MDTDTTFPPGQTGGFLMKYRHRLRVICRFVSISDGEDLIVEVISNKVTR